MSTTIAIDIGAVQEEDARAIIDSALGCYAETTLEFAEAARADARDRKGPHREASARLAEAFEQAAQRTNALRAQQH